MGSCISFVALRDGGALHSLRRQSALQRSAPEMLLEDRQDAIRIIQNAAELNYMHRNSHEKQAHTFLWGIGALGMGKTRLAREALKHLLFGKPPLYIFIDYRNGDCFHSLVDPLGADVAFSVRLAARSFAGMSLRQFCSCLGEIEHLTVLFKVFNTHNVMKHCGMIFVTMILDSSSSTRMSMMRFIPFFTAPSRLGIRNRLNSFCNFLPPIGPLSSESAIRIMADICSEATLALPAFRRLLAACCSVPRALQLLREQLFASGKPIPLQLTESEA